ncbi:hypothetical protein ACHWQZ_G001922 [Mnemiopsis leidyi]
MGDILRKILHLVLVLCPTPAISEYVIGSSDTLTRETCLSCEKEGCLLEDPEELHLDNEMLAEEIVLNQPGDIMIGGLVPLKHKSTSKLRYHNVALVEAIHWAVHQINRNSEILPNFTVGYEIRDTMSDPAYASVQALELAAKNVVAIVGPGSTSVAVHLASLMGSLGYPMISYAATSNILSNTDRFSLFARTVPSDAYQCSAIKDIILNYGWDYVSILFSPETYGTDGAELIRTLLKQENKCIDKYTSLPTYSTEEETVLGTMRILKNSFKSFDSNTNKMSARVVVLFATFQYAKQVIEAARRLKASGWGSDFNLWGNLTWIAPESWSKHRELIQTIAENKLGYLVGVTPTTIDIPDFTKHFKNLTPDKTNNTWFKHFYTDCGGNITNCGEHSYTKQGAYEEQVVIAVEVIARTLHSLLGTKFNPSTLDFCLRPAKPIPIMRRQEEEKDLYYLKNSLIGKTFFKALISKTFSTTTRTLVSFNRTNGDFEATYTFVTYNTSSTDHDLIKFGEWNSSHKSYDLDGTLPYGGAPPHTSICSRNCPPGTRQIVEEKKCCWRCEECGQDQFSPRSNSLRCQNCPLGSISNANKTGCVDILVTYLDYTHPAGVFLITFSTVGCFVTFLTIIVFIRHANTPIVKASGKEFCVIMLSGVFLGFLSTLLCLGKPTDDICTAHLWLGTLFGSLTIIPLFLKVTRVFSLFTQSKKNTAKAPKYLLPLWQSVICFILVVLQIILLSVSHLLFPLKAVTKYPDRKTVLITCEGDDFISTALALGLPLGYVFFFMILSTIMSYRVRKLPSNFQEAKYVCLAQVISIIVLSAFVPAYFTSRGLWQTFSVGMASQICASSILILIFFKKVNIILLYPERNKVVLSRDSLKAVKVLEMSRDDRRDSYLRSEHCHMCGHMLGPGMSFIRKPGGKKELCCTDTKTTSTHYKLKVISNGRENNSCNSPIPFNQLKSVQPSVGQMEFLSCYDE